MNCVSAKVIAYTQPVEGFPAKTAEELVAHCARVSSPTEYDDRSKNAEGLLRYCIRNRHWSIFQMVNANLEVNGPRDITRQFLRHESLFIIDEGDGNYQSVATGFDTRFGGVQEFSQRYSSDIKFCEREVRLQDQKNRQSSIDVDDVGLSQEWYDLISGTINESRADYSNAIGFGVAKECARVILPEGLTMSQLYVNGTLRSWLHFLDVREGNGTQKEHVQLANAVREALEPIFPTILGMAKETA